MVQGTSVVTPERFASGLTYQDYIAQIQANQDRFQENYEGAKGQITDEDVKRFKELMARPNGPAMVLVLGEDWCPDVYRGMREIYAGRTREEAADDISAFQRGPVWAGWRHAQIDELRQLLDEKTK